jgi:hypothetical protein
MDRRGTCRLSQAAKPPNGSTCSGFCDLRLPDGCKTNRRRCYPGISAGSAGNFIAHVWAANAVPIWQATMPSHATVVAC